MKVENNFAQNLFKQLKLQSLCTKKLAKLLKNLKYDQILKKRKTIFIRWTKISDNGRPLNIGRYIDILDIIIVKKASLFKKRASFERKRLHRRSQNFHELWWRCLWRLFALGTRQERFAGPAAEHQSRIVEKHSCSRFWA